MTMIMTPTTTIDDKDHSPPLPLEFTTSMMTASTPKVNRKATTLPMPNRTQLHHTKPNRTQPHHTTANAKSMPFGRSTTCYHLKTPGTTHQCNPLGMMLATPTPFRG